MDVRIGILIVFIIHELIRLRYYIYFRKLETVHKRGKTSVKTIFASDFCNANKEVSKISNLELQT